MTVYLLSYFITTFFAFLYSKGHNKYSNYIFSCITFLAIFLPLALRYNVGTDYKHYVTIINNIIDLNYYYKLEYGWFPIVWIIKTFHLDVQIFFIIPAFISTLIIFYVVPKKYFWFCIPVYISLSWINSFTFVRQTFAATIFLLAIKARFENRFYFSLLWTFLAGLFHTSIFIFLLLLPLTYIKKNLFSPIVNIIIINILCIIILETPLIDFILYKIVPITPYARYLDSIYVRKTQLGTGLGILLNIIIFLIIVIFSSRNTSIKIDYRYNLICFFTLIMCAVKLLSTQIHIFWRLNLLFDPFYIYMMISLYEGNSKIKKYLLLFILMSMFIFFYMVLLKNPSTISSGLKLVPYVSIFER